MKADLRIYDDPPGGPVTDPGDPPPTTIPPEP